MQWNIGLEVLNIYIETVKMKCNSNMGVCTVCAQRAWKFPSQYRGPYNEKLY